MSSQHEERTTAGQPTVDRAGAPDSAAADRTSQPSGAAEPGAAATTDVFISYSRADGEFVAKLNDALAARGKDAWVDWEDIPPTAVWRAEIDAGIDAATAFVVVLSPDWLVSKSCARELEHALAQGKRILPVVHRDPGDTPVPPELADRNWIFAREADDLSEAVAALVEALESDLERVRSHTRLLMRATEWASRDRDHSLLLSGSALRDAELWLAAGADSEPRPTPLQAQFIAAGGHYAASRQRRTLVVAGAVVAALAGIAIYALIQRGVANDQANKARSRALAAESVSQLSVDPELSLILALRAEKHKTAQADVALRRALVASHVRARMVGHRGAVTTVAFSPNQRLVLTAGQDGTARVWDARSGRPTLTVRGGTRSPDIEGLHTTSLDIDGSRAVTVARVATLWDLRSGHRVATLPAPPQRRLQSAAFAGDRVVTTDTRGPFDQPISRIWDVTASHVDARVAGRFLDADRQGRRLLFLGAAGPLLTDRHGVTLAHLAGALDQGMLSANGSLAVATSAPKFAVSAWPTAPPYRQRRLTKAFTSDNQGVGGVSMAVSDDGRLVATAVSNGLVEGPGGVNLRGDQTIHVWNARTGAPVAHLRGHSAVVRSLAFSRDGHRLASGSDDRTARVWNVHSQRAIAVLRGHTGAVRTVAFDRSGLRLVTGSDDGTARVWAIASQAAVHHYAGHFIETSANGAYVAIARRSAAVVRQLVDGRIVANVPLSATPEQMVVSPTGRYVAVAASGGNFLWNNLRGSRTRLGTSPITFDGTGRVLVTNQALVRADSGKSLAAWSDANLAGGAALTRDARRLVLIYGSINGGGGTELPSVRNARTGHRLRLLPGSAASYAVAISPDDRLAAIATNRGDTGIWDIDTGKRRYDLVGTKNQIVDATTFSPDGRLVASGGHDTVARIWNVRHGGASVVLAGHVDSVRKVEFSPGGEVVLTAGDRTVRIWDPASGAVLAVERLTGTLPASVTGESPNRLPGFAADGQHFYTVEQAPDGSERLTVFQCDVCGPIARLRKIGLARVTRSLTRAEASLFGGG